MYRPILQSRHPVVACAIASLALTSANSPAQTVVANSQTEFSGIQGQNDWTHGYRSLTVDGGSRDYYDPSTGFIEFTPAHWTGTQWDLGANAPWTNLQSYWSHPNGTNHPEPAPANEEHWPIRRWTAPGTDITGPTVVRIDWTIGKTAAGGTGVTAQLHKNGSLVALMFHQGNGVSETQVITTSYLTVNVGDRIDLALSPVGIDLSAHDGDDTSATKMVITTAIDSDNDLLADAWEETYFPGDLTQLSSGDDYDLDGLNDEEEAAVAANPKVADTDGDGVGDADDSIPTNPNSHSDTDGFTDAAEQAANSDPLNSGDTPVSMKITDSRTAWTTSAGVQGVGGWSWGYRNYSADGGGDDYDPSTSFIPYLTDGTTTRSATNSWNGSSFAFFSPVNPPWTNLSQESTHPNSVANGGEHWTARRWTVTGLAPGETPVSVIWHTRKGNTSGNGVTGSINLNGVRVDTQSIAGSDTTGFQRRYYLHLKNGDQLDLLLTPVSPNGSRDDGSDGSANWIYVDARLLQVPVQPDGSYFIPNNATDSDTDSLADFWEEEFFPGDLTQLAGGEDYDLDGAFDEEEMAASTDPTDPDMDGDGLTDGEEADAGTDPRSADTDGDGFSDRHELFTGYDPLDPYDSVHSSFDVLADSLLDFPDGQPDPQGFLGWNYGYYDISADGEPPSNTNFIPFLTDGTTTWSETNFWTGTVFDWYNGNPPWTQLGEEQSHPNTSTGQVQWVSRRWLVNTTGPLALNYHLRKQVVTGGNGISVHLLHNGRLLGSLAVEGTDGVGLTSWRFINAYAGDTVEVVLSPKGPDGVSADSFDGSYFWLIVDANIPANPLQPDGSAFHLSLYDDWIDGYYPGEEDPAIVGPAANPDGDALGNLLEFGFGTDPGDSDSVPLSWNGIDPVVPGTPVVVVTYPVGGGVDFMARFMRRKDHDQPGSLHYTLEFSADLSDWETSDEVPTPAWVEPPVSLTDDASGNYELVEIPYPLFLDNGKKAQFFRVTVTSL